MWNAASACKPARICLFLLGFAIFALGVSAKAEGATKSTALASKSLKQKPQSRGGKGRSRAAAQPPAAPGGLTVSGASASGFTLSWSAPYDNLGVAGYD